MTLQEVLNAEVREVKNAEKQEVSFFFGGASAIFAFLSSDLSNRQCFVRTGMPLYKSSNSMIVERPAETEK